MAPSTNDSPADSSRRDNANSNLQPFFVLRPSLVSDDRRATAKTRRKIDLSDIDVESTNDDRLNELKTEAFNHVWSTIDSSIKDVLRNINKGIFEELRQWILESFQTIRSHGRPAYAAATQSYPTIPDASLKQLYTGFVLTKNTEFVDDLLTFEDLGRYLKSCGCHVANLSSLDLLTRNGIGGCLRSLLRQFLTVMPDVADMSILSSWYNEKNYDNPLVIIVDDLERCTGQVLPDFISMLSEWVVRIPVILIMGVATTLDAPRSILPCDVLQLLRPFKFNLGSPSERMDAVMEAFILRTDSCFSMSHMVLLFLRNYFLRQDGTLTSFIRALKMACVQHFHEEPLSFLLKQLMTEDDTELQHTWNENHVFPCKNLLKQAFEFPSCKRNRVGEPTVENLAKRLIALRKSQRSWSTVVRCLYEAGKPLKIQLLDLCCEALDPREDQSRTPRSLSKLDADSELLSSSEAGQELGEVSILSKYLLISKIVRRIRSLSEASLQTLLEQWKKYTEDIPEIHEKVKELQFILNSGEGKKLRSSSSDMLMQRRNSSQSPSDTLKDSRACSERAVRLIKWMLCYSMSPIECQPFHEICCYKDIDKLRSVLVGDPRRTIHSDLMGSSGLIHACQGEKGTMVPSSAPDTAIMYLLAQEHGDPINLYEWYQSFKDAISCQINRRKNRPKSSPSPKKKRKEAVINKNQCEATLQARFCRAVTELQIAGLLRMPSKRRPDHVQRVTIVP